jgi:hypothetical protein
VQLYSTTLKLAALVFFVVAGLHLVLGLGADQLLGAILSPETIAEPTLDSQNRFYGVAFGFYGVALYICAKDLTRFRPILVAALAVFFMAGCARLVSWGAHGAPAPLVTALMAIEIILPPLLYSWLRKVTRGS